MRFTPLLALLLPLLTLACTSNPHNNPKPSPAKPGSLSFSAVIQSQPAATSSKPDQASVAKFAAADASTIPGTEFDYGNIASTSTYFFELKNVGGLDINNVTITTDNAATVVSPNKLGLLPTEGSGSVVPLIAVQVLHGVGLNGYGTADTLPPGDFSFNLTAAGVDTGSNPISASVKINLVVQVANLELWAGDKLLRVGISNNPNSIEQNAKVSTAYSNFDKIPATGWWFTENYQAITGAPDPATTRIVTAKNTGNVPIIAHNMWCKDLAAPESYEIPGGESRDIPVLLSYNQEFLAQFEGYVYFDSNSTVFNSTLPATETDGRLYTYLLWNENGY